MRSTIVMSYESRTGDIEVVHLHSRVGGAGAEGFFLV